MDDRYDLTNKTPYEGWRNRPTWAVWMTFVRYMDAWLTKGGEEGLNIMPPSEQVTWVKHWLHKQRATTVHDSFVILTDKRILWPEIVIALASLNKGPRFKSAYELWQEEQQQLEDEKQAS